MNDRITKKVVVDAGHGGSDPGASSADVIEKEYNLKIANYIYNRLKELGIPTYITRSTDETITPTDRVNRILNAFGNSNDVIVLSNHLNAGGANGKNVGKASSILFALKKDFGLMFKFFFLYR